MLRLSQVAARLSVFGLLMLACAAILLAYEQVGSSPTLPNVDLNSRLKQLKSLQNRLENGGLNQMLMHFPIDTYMKEGEGAFIGDVNPVQTMTMKSIKKAGLDEQVTNKDTRTYGMTVPAVGTKEAGSLGLDNPVTVADQIHIGLKAPVVGTKSQQKLGLSETEPNQEQKEELGLSDARSTSVLQSDAFHGSDVGAILAGDAPNSRLADAHNEKHILKDVTGSHILVDRTKQARDLEAQQKRKRLRAKLQQQLAAKKPKVALVAKDP